MQPRLGGGGDRNRPWKPGPRAPAGAPPGLAALAALARGQDQRRARPGPTPTTGRADSRRLRRDHPGGPECRRTGEHPDRRFPAAEPEAGLRAAVPGEPRPRVQRRGVQRIPASRSGLGRHWAQTYGPRIERSGPQELHTARGQALAARPPIRGARRPPRWCRLLRRMPVGLLRRGVPPSDWYESIALCIPARRGPRGSAQLV